VATAGRMWKKIFEVYLAVLGRLVYQLDG